MHRQRSMRSVLLLAALAAPAFAQGSIFPSKAQKDMARRLDPTTITEESRVFLRETMKSHGKEMRELSLAVATVKPAEVKRLAKMLADEPRLDPASGPAMKLPAQFFELQEGQKKRAQELSDAAEKGTAQVLQEKYLRLVQQCMACHAAFNPAP